MFIIYIMYRDTSVSDIWRVIPSPPPPLGTFKLSWVIVFLQRTSVCPTGLLHRFIPPLSGCDDDVCHVSL